MTQTTHPLDGLEGMTFFFKAYQIATEPELIYQIPEDMPVYRCQSPVPVDLYKAADVAKLVDADTFRRYQCDFVQIGLKPNQVWKIERMYDVVK